MKVRQVCVITSLIVVLVAWLTACQHNNTDEPPLALNSPVKLSESPVPVSSTLFDNSISPIITSTSKIAVVPFRLEKPLIEGDTKIKGSGPPNVPIVILDITFMGQLVAIGSTDEVGNFTLTVAPLEKGHWLGLALGNLSTTNFTEEDFRNEGFYGEEVTVVPQIGFFYDTTTVASP